jgi:hypothetical protein
VPGEIRRKARVKNMRKSKKIENDSFTSKLTCPICNEPIGNRENVILHMTCCSFVRAHKKCVDDIAFYKKFVVDREPEMMSPRSI